MVVETSSRLNNSWTVRMSAPRWSAAVAKQWRKVWLLPLLVRPDRVRATLVALLIVDSSR